MKLNQRPCIFLLSIVAVCMLCMGSLSFAAEEKEAIVDTDALCDQIPLFTDALTFIKKYYVRDVDDKELIYGALRGMLGALDPFSEFLPPQKYEAVQEETQGEFGGLGLVVSMKNNALTVVTAMEGTPAYHAGVMTGDVIVAIDDTATSDVDFSDAVDMMRGKPGTEVTLSVIREGEDKILKFPIERAVIEVENVKDVFILEDKIGYARIVDFGKKTRKMLRKALSKLEAEGAQALILDLRNNPGGLLDAAVDVCNMFLKKGDLIVYTKDRSGEEQLRFEATGKDVAKFQPLVILVNGGSASGSEIVAGAVKDNKRGIIIGKKTFGKASVQTVVPLRDSSAIRLTTALYYTPSGVSIHGKGIEPDIEVEYDNVIINALKEKDEKTREKEKQKYLFDKDKRKELLLGDAQVKRAVSVIKGIAVWDSLEKR